MRIFIVYAPFTLGICLRSLPHVAADTPKVAPARFCRTHKIEQRGCVGPFWAYFYLGIACEGLKKYLRFFRI
jgi:hypothetical protein